MYMYMYVCIYCNINLICNQPFPVLDRISILSCNQFNDYVILSKQKSISNGIEDQQRNN